MNDQGDYATYHVLVFGGDGTEILLTGLDAGLHFPQVTIPRRQRVAENVTLAMEQQWQHKVVCLFELDSRLAADSAQYMIARYWRAPANASTTFHWIPVADLSENFFAEASDYRALQEALMRCGASTLKTDGGPFARLNWFEELCAWVGSVIAPKGLHLTENFRQLNACPTFSLIRFETSGRAVWFKAVGTPNEHEYAITQILASLFPKYVAELLGTCPDRNGWLMFEAEGTNLGETTDLTLWEIASAALAKLQIKSISSCSQLRDSGSHELNSVALAEVVSPFMDAIAGLMRRQPKVPPPVLSITELARLEECIREAILDLADLGIPDTLGHLDLNPGNIVITPNAPVFLDWAEAYTGHPFYTFHYLLQHFRRAAGDNPKAEEALKISYLTPWKEIAAPRALSEALALASLLAVCAYAAGTIAWRQPERLQNPEVAGYLRALARRMNREAEQLGERGDLCLR